MGPQFDNSRHLPRNHRRHLDHENFEIQPTSLIAEQLSLCPVSDASAIPASLHFVLTTFLGQIEFTKYS
jgi:hypothetical protein